MELYTESQAETFALAKALGKALDFPLVITLTGELGAGKTLFAKGFAEGMGLGDEVTSPTYTIINEYGSSPGLLHFDLYRLRDTGELYEIGFEDFLCRGDTIIIEWPEIAFAYPLKPRLDIGILIDEQNAEKRRITLLTDDRRVAEALNRIKW